MSIFFAPPEINRNSLAHRLAHVLLGEELYLSYFSTLNFPNPTPLLDAGLHLQNPIVVCCSDWNSFRVPPGSGSSLGIFPFNEAKRNFVAHCPCARPRRLEVMYYSSVLFPFALASFGRPIALIGSSLLLAYGMDFSPRPFRAPGSASGRTTI